MPLVISLHLLAAIIWVGGMFFAYMIVRVAAARLLEPPQRLPLWVGIFSRFFPWVWLAVIALPVSGYWMIFQFFGGFDAIGLHIQLMHALGWLMILLYLHLYFVPFRKLKERVVEQNWPEAGAQLNKIRFIVGTNLILGLVVGVIASGGRYISF